MKIREDLTGMFTHSRVFVDGKRKKIKPFKPFVENASEEEVVYIHDILRKIVGRFPFTIDYIKRIREERIIHCRITVKTDEQGIKGLFILDSDSFDILFDNYNRLIKSIEEDRIKKLL